MNSRPQVHLREIFNDTTKRGSAGVSLNAAVKQVVHKNHGLPEHLRRATYQTMVKLNEHPDEVYNTKLTRDVFKGMAQAGMLKYKYKHDPTRALRHVQKVYRAVQDGELKKLSPEERNKIKNRNLAHNREAREEEETKTGLVKAREKGAIKSLGIEQWQEAKGSISQVLNQKKPAGEEPPEEQHIVDMIID